MSTHLFDKEREFVDGLQADTGRDLDGWMAAISASGRHGRNEIIDWLRLQGFPFSRASWLERIHHNGGRLIYGEPSRTELRPRSSRPPAPAAEPPTRPPNAAHVVPLAPSLHRAPSPQSPPPPPPARTEPMPTPTQSIANRSIANQSNDDDIDTLMQAAKAYRPLAQALLRDVLATVPATDIRVCGSLVAFELGQSFAAMAPTPKGVRLHVLDVPAATTLAGLQRSKSGPAGFAALVHSVLLTDARQIDANLAGAIRAASEAVRGGT
jgi:hypothetical protein